MDALRTHDPNFLQLQEWDTFTYLLIYCPMAFFMEQESPQQIIQNYVNIFAINSDYFKATISVLYYGEQASVRLSHTSRGYISVCLIF